MKKLIVASALVLAIGCTREESLSRLGFTGDFCETEPRREKPYETGEETVVDALKPEDVLVAVNGYPLTKAKFDEVLKMKAQELSTRKGANAAYAGNQLAEFKKSYVPLFVNQRLLLDEAKRLKVLSAEEISRRVNEVVSKQAKLRKMPMEKLIKSFHGDFRYALYDIQAMIVMNALIKKHIPPVGDVTDSVVAAFQDAIRADIEGATKTNEMIRARMAGWKRDILAKKITFEELAKKYNSGDDASPEKPGYWGDLERGEIEDKRVQSAVFSLKVGEISDPVEDDDGFHLIRVLAVKPPEKNEAGRVIQDEVRSVEHIYVNKLPLLIQDADADLKIDLKRQMQLQAVNAYLENMKTNGANRIEFPHGKHLFD